MSKRRILMITPVVPLPPTGGGTRSFHFLKAAAETGVLDLICLQELDKNAEAQLQPYCNSILHKGGHPPLSTNFLQKLFYRVCLILPFFFNGAQLSHELDFFARKRLKQFPLLRNIYFEWLLLAFRFKKPLPAIAYQLNIHTSWWQQQFHKAAQKQYDLLLVDFTYMGFFPTMLAHRGIKKTVFNAHNAEHEIIQQSVQLGSDRVEKKWFDLQVQVMKKTESQCVNPGSQIFCCSENDKIKMEQLGAAALVHVIPNGVDLDYFMPGTAAPSKPVLLFTGTMNYQPNKDAMQWFLNDIFPFIQQQVPAVQVLIAGKKANRISTNGHSSVHLVNDPDDMRPLFEEAAVVIVPLRIGSGTRLKILEAAAMHKPIVTTTLGSEGLEGATDTVFITADSASDFATAVVQLLNDSLRCMQLGKAAAAWVTHSYSWKQIRSQISNLLQAA